MIEILYDKQTSYSESITTRSFAYSRTYIQNMYTNVKCLLVSIVYMEIYIKPSFIVAVRRCLPSDRPPLPLSPPLGHIAVIIL